MKILMLCMGNICRSPLAEGILRSKIAKHHEVDSAGTISMHEGKKADHRSITTGLQHGIDINSHRARPLCKEDFEIFDKIYCMDVDNFENASSLAKNDEQRQKLSLILDVMSSETQEVPDPYWGTMEDFEKVYQMLNKACEIIAKELN
ncbi:MAG: low molecular weight phosphotyrosine protein phosphatase [Cloacibacterium sp.]|nr:low molecular weight phosphotyrosine protein phosphatase [Cloacibacterium sp.]